MAVTAPLDADLRKAARDPQLKAAFLKRLMISVVYVPVTFEQRSSGPVPRVQLDERPGVGTRLAVFTSASALHASVGSESAYMTATAETLLRARQPGLPVAINPGEEFTVELTSAEVDALLAGTPGIPTRTLAEGSRVRLGLFESAPEALLERLGAGLAGVPMVESAHLGLIEAPATGEAPHPLLGVSLVPGAALESVAPAVAALVAAWPDPIDIVGLDTEPLGRWLREHTPPFFVRGR